jgi:hypothetical protein
MRVARVLNVALLLALGASLEHWWEAFRRQHVATSVPRAAAPPAPSGSCYERVRHEHPEVGSKPFDIRLRVGISGRVKHIGPLQPDPRFQLLLPCIREDVSRRAYQPNPDEYDLDARVWPAK